MPNVWEDGTLFLHHKVSTLDDKPLLLSGYDTQDDMLKVKSVQKKFRDSFTGATISDDYWETSIGTGGSISQSAGTLILGSGTTINSQTSVLTKQTFTIPFRISIGLTLSQRIANQTFIVEAISVDPVTGIPNGLHSAGFYFDGTSATQAKYAVQNGGLAALISGASTVVTTASGGLYEIEPFADETWFHSGALDAVTARANSYRRHQQIPDPNSIYKIRLRWLNGAIAPASNTNATIQFLTVQDYAELTAEITAGRGQTSAGQGLGVNIIGTPAVTVTSGSITAAGTAAHDTAVTGNPVRVAGRAISSAYTTVASNDTADLVTTLQGVLISRPWQIPELEWSYAAVSGGITDTADVTLAAAAGAGLRRYITALQLKNINGTTTEVVLKDGSTVIWRGHVSATMGAFDDINFSNPLKTSANAALNIACITTGAQLYVNAQGYTAP